MRFPFVMMLAAALALGGCVPLIAGAGGAAIIGAAQDRGLEQAVDDNEISFEINRKLLAEDSSLYRGVATQVRKGRVLLSGYVPKAEDRATVTRVVWTIGGVKEVINELHIGEGPGFSQNMSDSSTTTSLRTRLMGDEHIDSINYSLKTQRGVIYILGTAKNQSELDRVLAHARDISGVRNVVSYVDFSTEK